MKTTLLFLSVLLSANIIGQNVYIPNAVFKLYLVGNSEINTNGDTEIQVSEATAFDGQISCHSSSISDLTGIEAFTALTTLYCSNNQLTILDLSQNTALTSVQCVYNQLTSLDVSQNTALTSLDCGYNQLTSLDVSQNTALDILRCGLNQLTILDVSQNTALTELVCDENFLTSLDVSQNAALEALWCQGNQLTILDVIDNTAIVRLECQDNQLTFLNVANGSNINMNYSYLFNATSNPNLTCIEVDDAEWSTVNWPNIDPQTSFSGDCTSSITELSTSRNIIQILDLMGRETSFKPNTPLIYVYDDGSIEKVFSVEY